MQVERRLRDRNYAANARRRFLLLIALAIAATLAGYALLHKL